jgi:GR25 family glycosyltransferase involved in LPS biosynthesis
MDFLDIISLFTDCPKEKIGVYVIHLERATERLPLMSELNNILRIKPEIITPDDGEELTNRGHPIMNSVGGKQPGSVISCTRSHVMACKLALERGKDYCIVFEDDVALNKTLDNIANIILQSKNILYTYNVKWDIFLLGALGYPSHIPGSTGISSVYNFDGTHALLFNRKTMNAYISLYYRLLTSNNIEPADGMYDKLILEGLTCVGFTDAKMLFDQKQDGMWSYIGNIQK